MAFTNRTRLLDLAHRRRVVTADEVRRAGIHSQQLTRLVAEGVLQRIARGQFWLAERPMTEHHRAVQKCRHTGTA
jgi:predicted transcriptional regulator of viral defense system